MPAASVEDFLAAVPEPQRAALVQLRAEIRAAVPEAREVISYGVPTYKLEGSLVSFGAAKEHCSLYVMSPAFMETIADRLAGYETSKGTVRFQPDRPLPRELVEFIVAGRLAENRAHKAARKAGTRPA